MGTYLGRTEPGIPSVGVGHSLLGLSTGLTHATHMTLTLSYLARPYSKFVLYSRSLVLRDLGVVCAVLRIKAGHLTYKTCVSKVISPVPTADCFLFFFQELNKAKPFQHGIVNFINFRWL